MTLLIASFFGETVEQIASTADEAWRQGADAVELRIDDLQCPLNQLNEFLRPQERRTWLVACRTQGEGGRFAGSTSDAASRVLDATKGTPAWMDIAWEAWQSDATLRAAVRSEIESAPSRYLILSEHSLSVARHGFDDFVAQVMPVSPQAIAKVAYSGDHAIDSFHALDLMRRFGSRVVAICMGEAGSWTRVLARKLGAFASIAAVEGGAATAPGQWSLGQMLESGWNSIDSGARLYAVVGDPVRHSLSPQLFNHWFKTGGGNAIYVPVHVEAERGGLTAFLAAREQRPWLDLRGLSVTIPHKVEALNWAGEAADPMSREMGAANTVAWEQKGLRAYNTDCYAAVDAIASALGCDRSHLAGLSVDALGAGGASRAVCYGLAEMGCHVTVYARTFDDRTRSDLGRWGVRTRAWDQRLKSNAEVLVNCTSVGMWPRVAETPIPAEALHDRRLVFDLVYRPLKTRLMIDAQARGCPTLGGLGMFVRQAATQFALWTGCAADLESGRRLLEDALGAEEKRVQQKKSVALIGPRGSGKTTVGALLAQLLGLQHIDTDDVIEAKAAKTIAQIFGEEGEPEFRRRERGAVLQAARGSGAVISLGGGAVADRVSMQAIQASARIVWLTAPSGLLLERIGRDSKSARRRRPPLTTLAAPAEMDHVLSLRVPLYRELADLEIDTSLLTAMEVAQQIVAWMNKPSGV